MRRIKWLRKIVHHKFIQPYINAAFESDSKVVLDKTIVRELLELAGIKIKENGDFCIDNITDYKFNEIRKDDIVLDIGAGEGLFTILSAMIAKNVYYIEPITPDIVKENVKLNTNISNKIHFLDFAFGKNNQKLICEYGGIRKEKSGRDLSYILNNINPDITVVKCDCEGCEWDGFSSCDDFLKIRKIDIEYHAENKNDLDSLISLLKSHNFLIETYSFTGPSRLYKYQGFIHAKR